MTWHLLVALQVPLWCKEKFPNPCGDRDKFFLGGLPYLTRYESLIFEVWIDFLRVGSLRIGCYILHPVDCSDYQGSCIGFSVEFECCTEYFTDTKVLISMTFLILTCTDILQTVVLLILGVSTFFPIAIIGSKLFWKNKLDIARVINSSTAQISSLKPATVSIIMWNCDSITLLHMIILLSGFLCRLLSFWYWRWIQW